MIEARLRPGYAALAAVCKLARDSDGWAALMKDVLHLPMSMLPAVERAVRNGSWRRAIDPIASVKANVERDCRREAMGMNDKQPEAKVERKMIDRALRPGYAALVTARTLPLKDEAWLPLMRNVIGLPIWMLPAVQRTIGKGSWRNANDPLGSVRECVGREVIRMRLSDKLAAVKEK